MGKVTLSLHDVRKVTNIVNEAVELSPFTKNVTPQGIK